MNRFRPVPPPSAGNPQTSPRPRKAGNAFAGYFFLILFGLAFSGAGLAILSIPVAKIIHYQSMKSWTEVPAHVLDARLVTSRGSKGSTLYRVSARFEYSFAGRSHQGTRADLFGDSDESGGDYQRRLVTQLNDAQARNINLPCYVNPSNPADAILFREMRWGWVSFLVLFGFVFFAVGLSALSLIFFTRRTARSERELQARYPGEPWKWDPAWAAGRIRSSGKGGAIGLTIFALFWNVLSLPAILANKNEIFAKGHPERLFVILFPLVGVILIFAAWRAWRNVRVLGKAEFLLNPCPGVVGGVLGGVIQARGSSLPDGDMTLSLTCTQTTSSGESSQLSVLWQDDRTLRREAAILMPDGVAFPVIFNLPYDCPQTDKTSQIQWQLEFSGRFGARTAQARFTVPVFRTPASNPDFKPDPRQEQAYFAAPDPAEILKAAAVSIEPLPAGGRRYRFRPVRRWGMLLTMTIFTLIWTGIAVGLWFTNAPLPFPIIFSLFDLIILLLLADLWCWSGRVDVTSQGLACAGGIFFKSHTTYLTAAEIRRFFLDTGMTQGTRVFFDLKIETAAGKKITLGKRLPTRRDGEWLIAEMQRDLGLSL